MENKKLDLGLEQTQEAIDFSGAYPYPQGQLNNDFELQERAGVAQSTDLEGTRNKIAGELHEEEMQDLYAASEKSLGLGADVNNVYKYLQDYIPSVTPEDAEISLETKAAENELAKSFSRNPNTWINAAIDNDPELRDNYVKSELTNSFYNRLQDKADNMSIWRKISGFGMRMIPFVGTQAIDQAVIPFNKGRPLELSSLDITERQQEYFDKAAREMSPKDYAKFLDDTFEYISSNNWDPVTLSDFVNRMRHGPDASNDVFGLFEVATPVIKGINGVMSAEKAAGNVGSVSDRIVNAAIHGDKEVMLKEGISPSAGVPFQHKDISNYSSRVSEQIADTLADDKAQDFIQKYTVADTMSTEQVQELKKVAAEDFRKAVEDTLDEPADIVVDTVTGDSGEVQALITLGTGIKGDAAMNKEAATFFAKRIGLVDGSYDLVNKGNEGWFVRVLQPLKDKELTEIGDASADWSVKFKHKVLKPFESPINWVVRNFAGVAKVEKEAHAKDVQAIRKLTAARVRMRETYDINYNKLSKAEKQLADKIYKIGNKNSVWYTDEQLDDFGATEAIKRWYKDFKTISDIDYITNDDVVVRRLNREGYNLFSTKAGEFIGKEEDFDTVMKHYNNVAIKNGKDVITSKAVTADKFIAKYKDKGYKLIKVNKRSILKDDLNYNYMLVKPEDIQQSVLPRFITNYAAGGRRRYTYGTMFVKMGRRMYAGGEELNGYTKVLRAGLNRKEMQQFTDEVNDFVDLVKKYENNIGVEFEKALTAKNYKYFNVHTAEDAKAIVRSRENPKGLIDTNYRAKLMEDGEIYHNDNSLESVLDDSTTLDDALQDLVDMRNEYGRHRGNILDNINGENTKILNLNEIFDKTINKAAYSMTLGDLHNWYGREFRRNFLNAIDTTHGYNPAKYSDQELIRTAPLRSTANAAAEDRALIRAAENFQRHYLRIANAKTVYDKLTDRFMQRTAQALDAWIPGVERGGKVYETVAKADPSKAARALGFQAVMGWWNPAQLIKQGLGVLNTVALAPIDGTRAMLAYPLFRIARAFDNKGLVNEIAKACTKLVGISTEDFKGILKYMDEYGSWDATKMLPGMDAGHVAYLARHKIMNSQYFFMNEGTNANYVISDIAAYLAKKGKSFKEIAAYSDDLYLNMTKASESAFQAGQVAPTAMLAQWLSYPVRVVESLFNSRLTKAQRARLVAAQVAMWGVAGTFGDDEVAVNMYRDLREASVPDELAGVITNGLFTQWAAEYDIEFTEGLQLKELIAKEFSIYNATTAEFQLPPIPAAKFLRQTGAVFKAIQEAVAPSTGERDIYNYAKTVATTPNMISSLGNASKAFVAWHIGKFYNTHGDIIKRDVKEYQVLSQALGFGPTERRELSYYYEALSNQEEQVQKRFDELKPLIDGIVNYKEAVGFEDPHKKEQEMARLFARYDTTLRASLQMLRDSFPDSKAADKLSRMVAEALAGPNYTLNDKRVKVYNEVGPGTLEYIKYQMRKDDYDFNN